MGLLAVFAPARHVTLRVTSERGTAAFDAIAVLDRRHGFETQRFVGRETPFEANLPDGDVTIVVQPRDPTRPVVADYEVFAGSKRRMWVRSWSATPVLRRHGGAIIGAGLPGGHEPETDGPAAGALAI